MLDFWLVDRGQFPRAGQQFRVVGWGRCVCFAYVRIFYLLGGWVMSGVAVVNLYDTTPGTLMDI